MGKRIILPVCGLCAVLCWLGLVLLVNRWPPTATTQTLFLGLWGMALGLTAFPPAYLLATRATGGLDEAEALGHAARRSLLLGLVAIVLMALHWMGWLSVLSAAVCVLSALALELVVTLRKT